MKLKKLSKDNNGAMLIVAVIVFALMMGVLNWVVIQDDSKVEFMKHPPNNPDNTQWYSVFRQIPIISNMIDAYEWFSDNTFTFVNAITLDLEIINNLGMFGLFIKYFYGVFLVFGLIKVVIP